VEGFRGTSRKLRLHKLRHMASRLTTLLPKIRRACHLLVRFASWHAVDAAPLQQREKNAQPATQPELLSLSRTNTRKHARYEKSLEHYAATYGRSVRAVKRWVRRGKETDGVLPPLDDSSLMAEWLSKRLRRRTRPIAKRCSEIRNESGKSFFDNTGPLLKPRALLNTNSFARLTGLQAGIFYDAVQRRELVPDYFSDSAYLFAPENLEANLARISHRISASHFALAMDRIRLFVAAQATAPSTTPP
jgi:hypothetical protein